MAAVVVSAVVLLGTACLLWLGRWSRQSSRDYVGSQWRYQPIALMVALLGVGVVMLLVPQLFDVLRWGNASAPARGLGWLGVNPGDSWSTVGLTFLVVMTLVTAVVVYLQSGRGLSWSACARALPLALVFAVINSLGEELLFRVTLVEGLGNSWSQVSLALLAAVLFGVPHWLGVPGRLLGSILAAFMGYFLTLSILQTQGLAWAWGIHAAQDVVIMMILIGKDRQGSSLRIGGEAVIR